MLRKAIRVLKPGNYGEGHNAAWSALVIAHIIFILIVFAIYLEYPKVLNIILI